MRKSEPLAANICNAPLPPWWLTCDEGMMCDVWRVICDVWRVKRDLHVWLIHTAHLTARCQIRQWRPLACAPRCLRRQAVSVINKSMKLKRRDARGDRSFSKPFLSFLSLGRPLRCHRPRVSQGARVTEPTARRRGTCQCAAQCVIQTRENWKQKKTTIAAAAAAETRVMMEHECRSSHLQSFSIGVISPANVWEEHGTKCDVGHET